MIFIPHEFERVTHPYFEDRLTAAPLEFRAVRDDGSVLAAWLATIITLPSEIAYRHPLSNEFGEVAIGNYEYQQRVGPEWMTLMKFKVPPMEEWL